MDQLLQQQSISLEKSLISRSQGQCATSSGSMLPPIHFLHSLLRHSGTLIQPALSERMKRFPGWTMPLNEMRQSVIAYEQSSDPPPSCPCPHTIAGASPQINTTIDKNNSWRRAPKRWGLAEWERDDSGARERRREQNREAQRRFREKRLRAADLPPPPE